MHKRTKACQIPPKVKRKVYDRDDGKCIFCGKYGLPEAHIVSRAQGGLGVEKNIVTVCRECHDRMDNSTDRDWMVTLAKEYIIRHYGSWSDKECTYDKWQIWR